MAPPDPIAPHSAPIAAYMSAHPATNLAYVRHFARQDSAQSATFQSINSRGFTLSYTLSDGTEGEAFIEFATPLRRKEEIRPVLEEMAKEAESALGLPSSLTGPPPIEAIARAAYASATSVYTPPDPPVALDTFYSVPISDQLRVGMLFGTVALVGYGSRSSLPSILRDRASLQSAARTVFRVLIAIHAFEGFLALATCVRRGWYSPKNVLKWTASTTVFGVFSFKLLKKHARQVSGEDVS